MPKDAAPSPRPVADLTYEEARDELVTVVARLEAGGETLEGSLTLWERGEALAARCLEWLDGARARLDAARPDARPDARSGAQADGGPDSRSGAQADGGPDSRSGATTDDARPRGQAPTSGDRSRNGAPE